MTREEEITKRIFEVVALKEPNPHSFPFENLLYSAGYMDGAKWADSHPHWIRVEEALPPKKSEYDNLSNNVLATDGKEIYESVYNYDFEDWFTHDLWELDNITHWCHSPQLPVLSNSENTGKDLKGGEK